MKTIVIASDHGGFRLKKELRAFLEKKGYALKDLGCFSDKRCDYPLYAYQAALRVSVGMASKGILICKSGIGNSIVANKLPGVRAALCYSLKSAKLSRKHNDANILVLGALFIKSGLAKRIVNLWLNTGFEGGRHLKRIRQIRQIEKRLYKHELPRISQQ